ncbi:MAG: hypothetical protein HKN03_15525 [Acidimicrobiales bacterium]|nr:hypothetical protein [Acidimicrobiales bacterium]
MSMQPSVFLLSFALLVTTCGSGSAAGNQNDGSPDFHLSEAVLSGGIAGICEQLRIDSSGAMTFVESCFSPTGQNTGQLTPLGLTSLEDSLRGITTNDFRFDAPEPECCDMFSFGLTYTSISGDDSHYIEATSDERTPEVFTRSADLATQLMASLRSCQTTELMIIEGDCSTS